MSAVGSTPSRRILFLKIFSSLTQELRSVGSYLSQNLTFSQLLFGRVSRRILFLKIFSSLTQELRSVGSFLSQNLTFSQLLFGRVSRRILFLKIFSSLTQELRSVGSFLSQNLTFVLICSHLTAITSFVFVLKHIYKTLQPQLTNRSQLLFIRIK